jgi:starch phosphorylase
VDEHDDLHRPVFLPLASTGPGDDGMPRYEGQVPLARAGSYGYTVRVLPHNALLPGDTDLGLLAQA